MIPNYIKNKIRSYISHSQKANILRNEIEIWFENNGVNTQDIEDVLIDSTYSTGESIEEHYNNAIELIENEIH